MDALPLSRALLDAVLADRVSDRLVCELVWIRLGYEPPEIGAAGIAAAGKESAGKESAGIGAAGIGAAGVGAAGEEPSGDGATNGDSAPWRAGADTPPPWAEAFPNAPQVIATRPASVRLTRSIPAEFKQLLKQQLGFPGYRINELYPRRTRRATAVNWLLADLASRGEDLPELGPLPPLLPPPADPVQGHPGDLPVS